MSERTFELSYIFASPWAVVCRAYLAKYPHPLLSHVETIDTLERYVDEAGRLITYRIMTSSFLSFSSIEGFEQSIIDPVSQTIYLNLNNMSHRNFTKSNEICKYSVKDTQSTQYSLSYKLNVIFGLGIFIDALISTVKKNFEKGTKVIEDIIQKQSSDKTPTD